MQWHRSVTTGTVRSASVICRRAFSRTAQRDSRPVSHLKSWDVTAFRRLAFDPALPAQLPSVRTAPPPACQKWFSHDDPVEGASDHQLTSSKLDSSFWQQYQDITVPIELTRNSPDGKGTFHRSDGPFKLFLNHSIPLQSDLPGDSSQPASLDRLSLYIAQCALVDLPRSLQADLPTPEFVLKAGRGDIYGSSLWMGRPPTFTPLHKDPNPNLFMQLAGQKVVRLFDPAAGKAIFDAVQMKLGGRGNATFRGEEMMQGREREELEEAVWQNEKDGIGDLREMGFEAELSMGDALFIPKGWWHSVRGVGAGMNASVNWWFR